MYNKAASIKRKKENHLEQLKDAVNENGKVIPALFWDMFTDLPLNKQKAYLERAKSLVKQSEGEFELVTPQRSSL